MTSVPHESALGALPPSNSSDSGHSLCMREQQLPVSSIFVVSTTGRFRAPNFLSQIHVWCNLSRGSDCLEYTHHLPRRGSRPISIVPASADSVERPVFGKKPTSPLLRPGHDFLRSAQKNVQPFSVGSRLFPPFAFVLPMARWIGAVSSYPLAYWLVRLARNDFGNGLFDCFRTGRQNLPGSLRDARSSGNYYFRLILPPNGAKRIIPKVQNR